MLLVAITAALLTGAAGRPSLRRGASVWSTVLALCAAGACGRASSERVGSREGHSTAACPEPRLVAGGTAGAAAPPPACVFEASRTALPAQAAELGVHRVGELLSVNVPPGIVSLTFVMQGVAAVQQLTVEGREISNGVFAREVRQPDGALLLSSPLAQGAEDEPILHVPRLWTATLTFPNTSALLDVLARDQQLLPGTWSFAVDDVARVCLNDPSCSGGSADGTYDVTVLGKAGPLPDTGSLDVAFYLATASGLTAEAAVRDPRFLRMFGVTQSLYAAAGICLGAVTVYDLPDWARARYASVDMSGNGPCDPLQQLFTLSRQENTLNFFLVDEVVKGDGGTLLGVSGGIPGPASVGGTIRSGVAVGISDLSSDAGCSGPIDYRCGPDFVASTVVHEGGHYLGLFHPTEMNGSLFDPLVDTPTCACSTCSTNRDECGTPDAQMSIGECTVSTTCGGGANLMFWNGVQEVTATELSPQQGAVMRLNPLVH
jgi:hypothetical protein